MSTFKTPEWENNPVGDAACENLFKNIVRNKKFKKTKNKKNGNKNLLKNDEPTFKQKHRTQKGNHNQLQKKNILKLLNDSAAKSTVNVVTNKKDFDVKSQSKKKKKKNNQTFSLSKTASEQTKVQFKKEPSKTCLQVEKLTNFNKAKKSKNLNLGHTDTEHFSSNSSSAIKGGISAKFNEKVENAGKKKKKLNEKERKLKTSSDIVTELPVSQSQKNKNIVNNLNQRSKGKLNTPTIGSLNQEWDIGPISTKSGGESSFPRSSTSQDKQDKGFTYKEKKKQKMTAMLQKTLGLSKPDMPKTEKIKNSSLPLKERMLKRLKAARFRYLNEQIYSTDGKEAQKFFTKDPNAFKAYHDGYRQQVSLWPINPVDVIIDSVKKMPESYVIADFGCGEAKLAKSVQQKVHSFDLVAGDDSVTACDMAHVPLRASSVDVVVFCLSLMGTNLSDYLAEANRVLKVGGTLKIAEVTSRFTDVKIFIDGLKCYNFNNISQDLSNDLFYFLDFKKESNIKNKKKLPTIGLLPCLYKKR